MHIDPTTGIITFDTPPEKGETIRTSITRATEKMQRLGESLHAINHDLGTLTVGGRFSTHYTGPTTPAPHRVNKRPLGTKQSQNTGFDKRKKKSR